MRALLIDDHPLILSAMQALLARMSPPIEAIGVETAMEARNILRQPHEFDFLILDLQLRDADGFELLAELRALQPALPVLVVAASDRAADVMRAIKMGAMGFVPKRASNELLADALMIVLGGGIYVPPMLVDGQPQSEFLSSFSRPAVTVNAGPREFGDDPADDLDAQRTIESLGLTPRQTEVLRLILLGRPNKLIARELGVSVETVKDHVAAVLRGLGVNSRTQAVVAVSRMRIQGLASPGRTVVLGGTPESSGR